MQKLQVFGKNCKNFKYLEKIAKTASIWKKLQKFQVFGKNCRHFKYLEIIAKISSIWKKIADISIIWKKMHKSLANVLLLLILF